MGLPLGWIRCMFVFFKVPPSLVTFVMDLHLELDYNDCGNNVSICIVCLTLHIPSVAP